jgi:dCTP deaminase
VFLSQQDIQARLSEGNLGIDPPPDVDQLGSFAIDLRLGTQFLHFSLAQRTTPIDLAAPIPWLSSGHFLSQTVPLGESLAISPGDTLVAATLEYVLMPLDLAGFLFPRTEWERVGLSVTGGTIVDPGCRGKLTLTLRNSNSFASLGCA